MSTQSNLVPTDEKAVAVIEQKVSGMEAAVAKAAKIKSDADYESASKLLVDVKNVGRLIEQEKRKQLDPLNQALKATRDFWKRFEDQYANAEVMLKTSVLEYKKKLDARNAQKAATIAKNVQEGKVSFEKGVEKIDDLKSKPTTHEGVAARKVRKVRFQPISEMTQNRIVELAVKGYLVWDEVKARKDALAGIPVSGAEVYEEDVIAVGQFTESFGDRKK